MASRCDTREGVTLIESCSGVSNTLTESAATLQKTDRDQVRHHRHHGKCRKWSSRGIGSRSILLILAWQFIIQCSLGLALKHFNFNHQLHKEDSLGLGVGDSSVFALQEKYILGFAVFFCVLFPITSLLAEVVISRYRLVSYSLKVMWLLSIVFSVISVCEEANLFTIKLLILVTQYVLLGAFIASAVPLGIDQITGGSTANISAFIQWLTWAFFSGRAIAKITGSLLYNCFYFQFVSMIVLPLQVLLLSVGLILDFYFHHKLVKEPVTINPVSLIVKVFKYAAKHKFPVQRSAFTYCENQQPTRLDYGKSKYGGPFTTEQVEDVKTFWRILLVIMVSFISVIPLVAEFEYALEMAENLSSLKSETNCVHKVLHETLTPVFHIMYSIPLYELLIYPCLRHRGPSILQSAGIGVATLIVSSLYGIAAESMQHAHTNDTGQCMFIQSVSNIEILIGVPSNFMLGVTAIVLPKSTVEFVCAQAPYNMMGVLIGLLLTLFTLFMAMGILLFEAWRDNVFAVHITGTCGIWFYLTTLVLAVVSSALLGLVIRWYKARERDEITRSQDLVEEVYHKYQEQVPHD